MAYDCLNAVIGITESTCACTVAGLTNDELTGDWYKLSTSELYLDKLEGIVPLQAVNNSTDCTDEMAQFYYNARRDAIKMLGDDVIVGITQRALNGKKAYNGKIAGTSFSSTQALSSTYAGPKYSTVPMKGGIIHITKLVAMMNATATFDIGIYKVVNNSDEYELVETLEDIQSLANAKRENTVDITLQLDEFGCDFYFLYTPSGFLPKTNSISCGCGSVEKNLANFMTVSGVYGNDLSLLNSFRSANSAMGISLLATVSCDTSVIICEGFNTSQEIAKVMAYAVRYKAGELVHELVLGTQEINRYTMSSREYLWGKRNHFRKEYNERIDYLAQKLDLNLTGCYVCSDKRISKSGILV